MLVLTEGEIKQVVRLLIKEVIRVSNERDYYERMYNDTCEELNKVNGSSSIHES